MLVSFKPFCIYVIVHGAGLSLVPAIGLFHRLLWDRDDGGNIR